MTNSIPTSADWAVSVQQPLSGTIMAGISIPTTVPGIYVPYVSSTGGGPFSLRGVSSGVATGTTLTLANPAGMLPGDLLVTLLVSGSISAGFPAGFAFIWGVGPFTGGDMYLFTRRVAAGDPATTTYTGIQTGALVIQAAFGGMNGNLDVFAASPYASGTSTSPSSAGITTTLNGDLLLHVCGFGGSTSFTPAAGFTVAAKVDSISGTGYGGAIAYQVQTTAGATGAVTGALGASNVWGSGLFSFAAG